MICVIIIIVLYGCSPKVSVIKGDNVHLSIDTLVLIDEGEIGDGFAPVEPSIVINPTDRSNICAAAILDRVYHSRDGGYTWHKQYLKSSYGVYGDPVLVADSRGQFYFSHLSNPSGEGWSNPDILDRIVIQKSSDGGANWSDGSFVGHSPPKDQDKQWMGVDKSSDALYITWTEFDRYGDTSGDCGSRILFSKSMDRGETWTAPIVLSDREGGCRDDDHTVEGAVPAVGGDGSIYVAWSIDGGIYCDVSHDGGQSWLPNDVHVAGQPGGWEMDIPGLNRCNGLPVTAVDASGGAHEGRVYVNWSDQRNGEDDTDIWLAYSDDRGQTWSRPKRVNDDPPGTHQFLTWMTIDQSTGYLYFVFYDRRNHNDHGTDVYLAWSSDGGSSFSNQRISESTFYPTQDVFFGDYTNISAHMGSVRPVWTAMDATKTSIWTAIIEVEEK